MREMILLYAFVKKTQKTPAREIDLALKRMQASRAALARLLDSEHESLTLATLRKAAHVVGRQLCVELV